MAAPVLEQLLTELLEPDSAGIRRATARLREALEEPEAPEGLAALLREAREPQVRHLAAVLLRRLLRKLPPDLIDRLPHLVVEALDRETDSSARSSLAQLGAKLLLLGGPRLWEPLERWILQAAREPQRTENLLSSLVPDVLRALRELLTLDEAGGAEALAALQELLAAHPERRPPRLRPALELCLQVAGDECRAEATRARALSVVTALLQERPAALLHQGLLGLVLRGLLRPLCAEIRPENPDPEESWDEARGGEGPCPRHAAAQALDALAQVLPPEKLLKELVSGILGEIWGISGKFGGFFFFGIFKRIFGNFFRNFFDFFRNFFGKFFRFFRTFFCVGFLKVPEGEFWGEFGRFWGLGLNFYKNGNF
ncbi:importin-4-like isoform X2 [Chamaea fasciata]|uniref:importin-4-like isoform X2 n=1 Tax=Chamaea fasciata TaxID=190680 RepID=UPI003369CBE8